MQSSGRCGALTSRAIPTENVAVRTRPVSPKPATLPTSLGWHMPETTRLILSEFFPSGNTLHTLLIFFIRFSSSFMRFSSSSYTSHPLSPGFSPTTTRPHQRPITVNTSQETVALRPPTNWQHAFAIALPINMIKLSSNARSPPFQRQLIGARPLLFPQLHSQPP
jgi:hypothetical protein